MNEQLAEHIWEPCSCEADVCNVEVCILCEAMRSTTSGDIYYAWEQSND